MKLVALALALAATASAQQLTGKWTTNIDTFGTPTTWNLTLDQKGDTVTGEVGGDKLTGTLRSRKLVSHAQDPRGGYEDVTATLSGETTGDPLETSMDVALTVDIVHDVRCAAPSSKPTRTSPP